MALFSKIRKFLIADTSGAATSDLVLLMGLLFVGCFGVAYTVSEPLTQGADKITTELRIPIGTPRSNKS